MISSHRPQLSRGIRVRVRQQFSSVVRVKVPKNEKHPTHNCIFE